MTKLGAETPRSSRTVFHGLDAMRGVAAISVMIYHFSPFLSKRVVLPGAYLAVDLFFVLSGFVICHAYEEKLQQGMGLPRFLLVRLIRLYPLYIAGTLLGLFYVLGRAELLHQPTAGILPMLRVLALSLLFLPNLSDGPALGGLYPFDLAAWSLFFELAVNLVYAAVARGLTQRRLVLVVAGAAASLVVALLVFGSLDVGMIRRTIAGGACRVLFSFAMGVMIYRVRSKLPCSPIRARFALESLLLLLVAIFLLHPPASSAGIFDLICIMALFPAAIIVGARIEPAVVPRFGALLGYLSYPVYILHTPLLLIAAGAWKAVGNAEPNAAAPVAGMVFATVVLFASYVLTRWYDVPVRAYLSARTRRRPLARPSTQSAFDGKSA
jgi:peptidoglycan/LPS O-acetylase OafA/YrhL